MQTENTAINPAAELSGSYGSFNTQKEMVKLGTGLLYDRWAFDLRLSHIGSDGYRDRASAKLKSYFAQEMCIRDSCNPMKIDYLRGRY